MAEAGLDHLLEVVVGLRGRLAQHHPRLDRGQLLINKYQDSAILLRGFHYQHPINGIKKEFLVEVLVIL